MKKIYAIAFAALLAVGGLSLTSCGKSKADKVIDKIEACETLSELEAVNEEFMEDYPDLDESFSESEAKKIREAAMAKLQELSEKE